MVDYRSASFGRSWNGGEKLERSTRPLFKEDNHDI